MKYYIIAFERSGEMHGANLMKALLKKDSQAEFRFVGGEQMQAVGGQLHMHYKEVSVMGIWEVIIKMFSLKKAINNVAIDIDDYEPNAVVMIDGSSFNLRIAKKIKRDNLKTFFYIPPKRWAYFKNRTKKMVGLIDHMLCILPFEKAFFESYGIKSHYVGNPIMDQITAFEPDNALKQELGLTDKPIAVILPGSREQEVSKILAKSATVISKMNHYQWLVAGVDNLPKSLYGGLPKETRVVFNKTYDLLRLAKIAVVTSGTATLETALFKVPQVVVYRTSFLTAMMFALLVRLPFVSLANFVAGRKVVPELLQYNFTEANLLNKLEWLESNEGAAEIKAANLEICEKVGEAGTSEKTADVIVEHL